MKALVLLALFFGVQATMAAQVNLGAVKDHQDLSNTSVTGEFEDNYKFTTLGAGSIGVSITTISASGVGLISDFKGTLDGVGLAGDTLRQGIFNIKLLLGGDRKTLSGEHELVITGIAKAGGSYGGSIVVTPNAVPVPAALWLFGSGLLGLSGLRKKRG